MAEKRGVAILVGAGDAIGAAVARRFAKGGYAVCICRRDAAKSQGLVDELKAAGPRGPRVQRRCPSGSRGSEPVRRGRKEHRADRGLPFQRRIERQQAAAGHHRKAVLQGLGTRLLRRVSGRPRGGAGHASARPRHHLLYRRDRQRSWRPGFCGIFVGQIRTSRGGAGDGARTRAQRISTSCISSSTPAWTAKRSISA